MNSSHLLHPELFDLMPINGGLIADKISSIAGETAACSSLRLPTVSVVIRAFNEEGSLAKLLEDLEQQRRFSDAQVIVVDNESTDHTAKVAKCFGAQVVTLARDEFSYPRSMNLGVEAADNEVVYLTVGHALLSNRQTLVAAARQFANRTTAGVFGITLPNSNASLTERVLSIRFPNTLELARIRKAGIGVMGATTASISKAVWAELGGFDERYESGGEDTAFAARALSNGLIIIRDPLLAVHHTHGLGPINMAKQLRYWSEIVKGPQPLDKKELFARRPDLAKRNATKR